MAAAPESCFICGRAVLHAESGPMWQTGFYAVYSHRSHTNDTNTPAHLSRHTLRGVQGPLELNSSELDPEAQGNIIPFDVRSSYFGPISEHPPEHVLLEAGNAWGFVFHVACKTLLELSSTALLDPQAIMDLCLSFPDNGGKVNWGHDYGGLLRGYNVPVPPGEEPSMWRRTPEWRRLHAENPVHIPAVAGLFELYAGGGVVHLQSNSGLHSQKPGADIFANLPGEILVQILSLLSPKDVVSVRRASHAVAGAPLTAKFWESRFEPGQEFAHIPEARRYFSSLSAPQWQSICAVLQDMHSFSAVADRKRIWGLCSGINGLLKMMGETPCRGTPVWTRREPDIDREIDEYVMAGNDEAEDPQERTRESCVVRNRSIFIPSGLSAVFVSFVDIFGVQYISGLRFVQRGGSSVEIGYIHADNELCISLGPNISEISGFCMAETRRGLRALALVDGNGAESQWVGDHSGVPKRRLIYDTTFPRINKFLGGFDALKMVLIGLQADFQATDDSLTELCDDAIWYPEIPDRDMTFIGVSEEIPYSTGGPWCVMNYDCFPDYRAGQIGPLKRILIQLRRLDGVSLKIVSITLKHEHGECGIALPGITVESDDDFEAWPNVPARDDQLAFEFQDGEYIEEMAMQNFGIALQGFKITTNRQRSALFPSNLDFYDGPAYEFSSYPAPDVRYVRVGPEPIVGIWATMSSTQGIENFGFVAL
ncbi:hypothetical protein B0I35DRAFT_440639 [Stachybotrys elegans]|uniref:F-box domain-containing protein n=1 Tax=Stachybotrys elegans TaxID=80388 RepID=A0A8K0WM77_9HYPO|nr:hypothetical protein B0I35DRAFT_440639 [Stachybotrys elegans]